MDKNKFIIRYIHLESLFNLLGDLMKDGVEQIDIECWIDPEKIQDIIKVSVSKEEEEEPPTKSKMTEDDINELM